MMLANTNTWVVAPRNGALGSFYQISWKCIYLFWKFLDSCCDDVFVLLDQHAVDLFEELVNSGIWKKCPASLASKSFSEHLEKSE